MDWYRIKNIDTIDSPALVIYRERMQQNIRLLKEMVKGNVGRLRPHVKTNKITQVCQAMLDEGITQFKCATIAEAEMLAMIGAPDVLLAYQPVGPKALRLIRLIQQYPATHFSCAADNIGSVEYLSKLCVEHNCTLDIFIDLNTGMNRTGILPSKALLLYQAIQLLPAVSVIGLHLYDGHIHDTDISLRKQNTDTGYGKVLVLAKAIESISGKKPLVVAGGSPTLPIHAANEETQCSPGTFVFWDWGYQHNFPDESFVYAALVVTRVISVVDEKTITLDLGHKSVAAETPLPRVHFLNAPELIPFSQSEEHMVAKVPDAAVFKTGDVLYGVPVHICPTVALYERAVIVENNNATGEWKVVARDRKINI